MSYFGKAAFKATGGQSPIPNPKWHLFIERLCPRARQKFNFRSVELLQRVFSYDPQMIIKRFHGFVVVAAG
jgi:hypothetical protein